MMINILTSRWRKIGVLIGRASFILESTFIFLNFMNFPLLEFCKFLFCYVMFFYMCTVKYKLLQIVPRPSSKLLAYVRIRSYAAIYT